MSFSLEDLFNFVDKAGQMTYAGGAPAVETPERPDFKELTFSDGDWSYRDSYIGFYRSRGMEVVRFKGDVVWTSAYGGGMTEGNEHLADQAFSFLKKALSQKTSFQSVRGTELFNDGDWQYTYQQKGGIKEYDGYEEIKYKGELVFFHRIIGGIVRSK